MKCFQSFSMFDLDPFELTPVPAPQPMHPSFSDEMLPLILKEQKATPESALDIDAIFSMYLNNQGLNDSELQQLPEDKRLVLDQIIEKSRKKKRPDQYQKLFYKKGFKFVEKVFFKKSPKNKSRKMSQFYHHHFGALAQKMNVPLINFYHPDKKTRPGYHSGQKSFNSGYIKLVLASASFKAIIRQYHSLFRQECILERNKKIPKFTGSLQKMREKYKDEPAKLLQYLNSGKFKIPWRNGDIEEAWRRAGRELDGEESEEKEGQKEKAKEEWQQLQIPQSQFMEEESESIQEESD